METPCRQRLGNINKFNLSGFIDKTPLPLVKVAGGERPPAELEEPPFCTRLANSFKINKDAIHVFLLREVAL